MQIEHMSFTTTCSEDHGGYYYTFDHGVYDRDCFSGINYNQYLSYTSAVGVIAAAYIPGTKIKSSYTDPQTCYPTVIYQDLLSPYV